MKAQHAKYTVEFDVPIKTEDYKFETYALEQITNLFEQAVKIQLFYFRKEGMPTQTVRAKNIKINHEVTIQDYQI